MEKEEKSLKEKTDEIYKFVKKMEDVPPKRSFSDVVTGKNKPKKEFKLGAKITAGWKSKLKKNYVLVFRIRTNGEMVIHFAPINNDMVYVQDIGTYHLADAKSILRYKNYPAMILPEWSLDSYGKPKRFDSKEHYEEAEEKGAIATYQRVIINAMKMAALKPTGVMAGKTILWVLIAGVAVLYLISQIIGK